MSQVVDSEAMSREIVDEMQVKFPIVKRVVLEDGHDSTGDAALFVWVLLDDKVSAKDLSWQSIQPLVEAAEAAARARRSDAWPYARVRRLKEWDERNLLPEEEARAA